MKQQHAEFDVLLDRRAEGFVVRVLDSPVGKTGEETFIPPCACRPAVVAAIPIAAPTNVQLVGTSPVTLVWDSPPLLNSVVQWQVYRDGDFLGTTRSPRWRDSERLTGTHRYTHPGDRFER